MTNTVILVPRREGFPDRDRTWAWVRRWWEQNLPEFPIIEGHHNAGLFNRSAALNRASEIAGDWDIALIIDADVICDPEHVREAVKMAAEKDRIVVPFKVRHNLNRRGSEAIMAGANANWERWIARNFYDQHSSVIAVPRNVWNTVGGFDETFSGWGMEDTAFAISAITLVGEMIHMEGEVWHFYHPTAPEGHVKTPSAIRNRARGARYQAARGDPEAIRALLNERITEDVAFDLPEIPRIFHRTVPEHTSDEVEAFWKRFQELHPTWQFMTHRDPLNPDDWPLTAPYWKHCKAGAQLAGLIRLEALARWGGIYVDSDVEPYRAFDSLLPLKAFAAWEDARCIPDAVIGARRDHPAINEALKQATRLVKRGNAWDSGPGVTTAVFRNHPDVLLLPPGAFYPYHYKEKHRRGEDHAKAQPWAFGAHHWAGSWLKKKPEEQSA